MTAEVQEFISSFMPDFADAFMLPEYRSHAVSLALARRRDMYPWTADFEAEEIPIEHAAMIYPLTLINPFRVEVGETPEGYVSPHSWIIRNYVRFKDTLVAYSNGGIPVPPPPLRPIGTSVPREVAYVASSDGEQTIELTARPLFFDLYINGLRQVRSHILVNGSTMSVAPEYEVLIGDTVSVVYFIEGT